MELKNDDQNFEEFHLDQPRGDRKKQENLKPEHSVQAADPMRGKCPPLVFYILLGVSILLSVVVLGTAVILFTGVSEKTSLSLAEPRTNISQLEDITQMLSKMKMSDTDLKMEISQLKSTDSELFSEMKTSGVDFKMELSQMKQNVSELFSEMKTADDDFKMEFTQLKRKFTEWSAKLAAIENKFQQQISDLQQNDPRCTPCATGWRYFEGKCYQFSESSKNWHEANLDCFSKQSYLIVIRTNQQQNFMKATIMGQRCWIGLNDLTVEGQWNWVDGTDSKATKMFWASGEPNNERNNEHCVEARFDGKWNDAPCTFDFRWICERPSFPCVTN
ncbi:uncharacterized protein LOC144507536 [Mustelus asterias]